MFRDSGLLFGHPVSVYRQALSITQVSHAINYKCTAQIIQTFCSVIWLHKNIVLTTFFVN